MSKRANVPGIKPYNSPAGGWGALRATAKAVREQMDVHVAPKLLLRTNKPDGFDCPGCAWPDKNHNSTFQFCENGAKAVTWEATKRRVTLDFFYTHTVSSLLEWSDLQLESEGRVLFRYSSPDGMIDPNWNHNGAINAIAGIVNERGNVLGMMPHPENHVEAAIGPTDGRGLFAGLVEALDRAV